MRHSRSDLVLGGLGAAAVLLALVLWLRPAPADTPASAAPPAVSLLEPADGATLSGPVSLVFRTGAVLQPDPSGWGVGEFHLHAAIDGAERMAARGEVVRLGGSEYRWELGTLFPGRRSIRLFWSTPDHRPAPGGDSVAVQIVAPAQDGN